MVIKKGLCSPFFCVKNGKRGRQVRVERVFGARLAGGTGAFRMKKL